MTRGSELGWGVRGALWVRMVVRLGMVLKGLGDGTVLGVGQQSWFTRGWGGAVCPAGQQGASTPVGRRLR